MLSDDQIRTLANKMGVPLEFVDFKTELEGHTLKFGRSYIINMEDEIGLGGERNKGSHWTCFQVNMNKNGTKVGCYFDSFGAPPPQAVEDFTGMKMPYNHKDIQSMMGDQCGYFCLAFLYWINCYENRTGHLGEDAEDFTDLFEDLEKSNDFKKNEFVLHQFFRAKDPSKRKAINIFPDGVKAVN